MILRLYKLASGDDVKGQVCHHNVFLTSINLGSDSSRQKKNVQKVLCNSYRCYFFGDGCSVNYIITGIMRMNALHFSEKKTYSVLDGSVL